MAFSKQYLYPKDKQIKSALFKALAHAARLQILEQLEKEGPICVQVIKEKHKLCYATISGHLKKLREALLVECYERFPYTFYYVNEKRMKKARKLINAYLSIFKHLK